MSPHSQKLIKQITARLVKNYHPQRIILFGSHAWGKPGKESDIDLLVIKRTQKNFVDRYVEVSRLLDELIMEQPMDILVMTPREISRNLKKGNYFIEKILEDGKRLHG